jgi:mannosyl-oligosaccharide alpha-1,2-mannosidase
MDSLKRQFVHRRPLLNRALKSKASRLGILSASITILLVIALLTVSPNRYRSISLEKDVDIPAYRLPEPKSYDEPYPPNWRYRENAVKDAFLHAYRAYEYNAFPADELWPLSHAPRQKSASNPVEDFADSHI